MEVVIRRLSAVLFLIVVLGACGGDTRVAVDAGDDSLTREQLIVLTTALQNETVVDETAISANDLRQVGSAHMVTTAYFEYLGDIDQEIPDGLRGTAQDFVADQTNAGNIGELTFNSTEFEAYIEILMAQELLAQMPIEDAEFVAIIGEYTSDFKVESRLGTWDSDTLTIIAP